MVATVLLAAVVSARVDFALMRQVALSRYGEDTAALVDRWRLEIDSMKSLPDAAKLERANRFFNSRIRWVTDQVAWERNDYWATPLEVMGVGMGDCEDFAIAKYTTLLLAGVDVDKLRITYVKLRRRDTNGARSQAHMVLAYYPEPRAEPLILDNLVPDVLAASRRTDLTPVYGFNSRGLWVGGATAPASRQPEAKLSRWRDLLRRALKEGLN
ncbi:MAG: transglutaminase-like cysteine peptidase [Halioglobus sp.]|nr:transglutaminase-like cysteine peptidase [Halioglobus sp.]